MTNLILILKAWFEAIFGLVVPRGCAGCGRPDDVLCPQCQALFRQWSVRCVLPGCSSRGYACGWYRGAVRRAILSWKDHGDQECDGTFARALSDLTLTLLREDCPDCRQVVLVPAPSSRSSMHKRGRWQMMPLVRRMRFTLSGTGLDVEVRAALRLEGVAGKSVQTSGSLARSSRIAGHIQLVDGALDGIESETVVVVVDDIMTTGATMGQCAHVLESAYHARVIGLALAMTAPRGSDRQ
ncbi:ComF family protein [Bifidobacterium bohemicum]|nr:ComF family protein [Bifidobacterium bohemicum]